MKKILAMLMALAMLCCGALAEEPDFDVPGNELGFALLRQLYTTGENTVLSPLSLRLALGMAAAGAEGETLEQLLEALGAEDAAALAASIPEELKRANAAFVAPGLRLNPDYIAQMDADFATEWFELDAAVVENANAWVSEKTDGLIADLLKEAPSQDAGMVLINAIAMDANWMDAFDPALTAEALFHTPDGKVEIEMMHQTATFDYVEKHGMQIVRLPYVGDSLSMWIVLPGEDATVEMALNALESKGVPWLTYGAEAAEVALDLPKLDVSDENSLAEALQLLGIEDAFTDAANFAGISETPLRIGDVIQSTRVQIDEEGTRAASATAAVMMAMAMPVQEEPIEMIVDRPFAFVIGDAASGSVCFAGAIENPLP